LHDDDKAPDVAVVNREFARKVFGSADKALGGHFKYWGGSRRAEVIGVVEDGKYQTLTEDPKPAMFFSFLQHGSGQTWLTVRSERDPHEIAQALQRSMRSLDPALPLEISTWNSELDSALFAARVATVSLGVLGLLGAMLAITGIFGMAAYTVSKRLREIGIRIALGADQRKVLGAALGRTFRLLAVGSISGLILGVLATRVLSSIVYQATPKDPVILGGVILTMLGVGVVAALVPARRALAVDPMILLRDE
jgi:ABC-type antimicrobial peptide transport system permease subunit